MIEITLDSAIAGLRAIVAEVGEDFVYAQKADEAGWKSCLYVHNGAPDCIVGRYLASVGVPLERLAKADDGASRGSIDAFNLMDALNHEGVVQASYGVSRFLRDVQERQDVGQAWGEALEIALSRL
ncbi:MAG TPA: hypothetical protein VIY48_00970 [Candidatus Paceibacterota bacterium]